MSRKSLKPTLMITAAVLILFTLLCVAFTMDRAWSNVTLPERNDLVFEGRHREYGAYQLRKEYDHRLVIAFGCAVGLLVLLAAVPKVVAWLTPPVAVVPPIQTGITFIIDPPPYTPEELPVQKTRLVNPPIQPKTSGPIFTAVDSVIAPPPDTVNTIDQSADLPDLGSEHGGAPGSDPARTDALSSGPDTGKVPFPIFKVDEPPVFPGGEPGMDRWVQDNLDFPQGLAGKDVVYVQFTVDRDGAVTDARALTGRQAWCKEAAERTVSSMPRWKPARMNGHDVPCRLTLPIRFEVR